MLFYFPDSQDQIDPTFDMEREEHPPFHVRQRDDRYAHEALTLRAYDGMLVSKAMVDGVGGSSGRYTVPQRHRLYRQGAHRFFRLEASEGPPLITLGDCGAFTYVDEPVPPVKPDEVIDFYDGCGFDAGISPDHVILAHQSDLEPTLPGTDDVDPMWKERQAITLELAGEFLTRHAARGCTFEPVGAAQGWSPSSMASCVEQLQQMGYRRVALGGMVPLKNPQILEVLEAVDAVRLPETQLHLLGLTRVEHMHDFARFGVTSFDSTSPFFRAFKDDTDNYFTADRRYTAIRIPPVDGNAKVKRAIKSGKIDHDVAHQAEQRCLRLVRAYADRQIEMDEVLEALAEYHAMWDGRVRTDRYIETLRDRPWETCQCGICAEVDVEVVLFRGTERNKRRGFHNVAMFAQTLRDKLQEGH